MYVLISIYKLKKKYNYYPSLNLDQDIRNILLNYWVNKSKLVFFLIIN